MRLPATVRVCTPGMAALGILFRLLAPFSVGRGCITFDEFIRLNFLLQTYTNAFKQADTDQDGWVQLSYEQFLTLVMQCQ